MNNYFYNIREVNLSLDFSPLGYNLPSEYTRIAADCSRSEKDDRIWICKPVGQSQGKGIFLFRVKKEFLFVKNINLIISSEISTYYWLRGANANFLKGPFLLCHVTNKINRRK